jgi:tripartite-type tricarboxylate transporter receptor subunit TctC
MQETSAMKSRLATQRVRRLWGVLGVLAAGVLAAGSAMAEAFPSKAVTLVVPTPAAGPIDFFARNLTPLLSTRWGQPVVVDNKPGAGTALGTQVVARARADGHTLLVANIAISAHGALAKAPLFDVERELTPVAMVASTPYFVIVPEKSPDTLEAVVAYGKANPEKLNVAIIPNSQQHLDTARLLSVLGVKATLIPYPGTAPITRALVAGEVDLFLGTLAGMQPFFDNGRLRPLGVTSETPWPTLPQVPTLQSKGYSLVLDPWYAIFAPVKTPAPVLAKLRADVQEVLQNPDFKKKVVDGGYVPRQATHEEVSRIVSDNLRVSRELVRAYNIQPE